MDFPGGPVAKTLCSQLGDPGSIPGQGTRSHMPQLRVCLLQLKPHMLQLRPGTTKKKKKSKCMKTDLVRS